MEVTFTIEDIKEMYKNYLVRKMSQRDPMNILSFEKFKIEVLALSKIPLENINVKVELPDQEHNVSG